MCWCQKQAVTLPARQPHEADPIAACMHKPWSACYLTDCSCRNELLQWGKWRHDPHVALTAAKQCILPLLCFTVSVCACRQHTHIHPLLCLPSWSDTLAPHVPFPSNPFPVPASAAHPASPTTTTVGATATKASPWWSSKATPAPAKVIAAWRQRPQLMLPVGKVAAIPKAAVPRHPARAQLCLRCQNRTIASC